MLSNFSYSPNLPDTPCERVGDVAVIVLDPPLNFRVSGSSIHLALSFTRLFEFQSALNGGGGGHFAFGKWEAIQDSSPTGRQADEEFRVVQKSGIVKVINIVSAMKAHKLAIVIACCF